MLFVPENLFNVFFLPFVSAPTRLNCCTMALSSEERWEILCSAIRRRSFKARNSR